MIPKSKTGRWAVALTLPMLLVPAIPSPAVRFLQIGTTIGIALVVATLALLAWRRAKDRSVLVKISLVLALLVILFPLAFAAGELLFPHD